MKIKKVNLVFGMEIECGLNKNILGDFMISSYHSDHSQLLGKSRFYPERDSSLKAYKKDFRAVELVSEPFTYENVDTRIRTLIKMLKKTGTKLSDLIYFNKTMGCHIHFSVFVELEGSEDYTTVVFKNKKYMVKGVPYDFKTKVLPTELKYISDLILSRVKHKLPRVYNKFNKQFYRNYAQVVDFHKMNNRAISWNFQPSEFNHIEFRSFNLNGVSTYEQLEQLLKIGFGTIKTSITNIVLGKNKVKTKIIRI